MSSSSENRATSRWEAVKYQYTTVLEIQNFSLWASETHPDATTSLSGSVFSLRGDVDSKWFMRVFQSHAYLRIDMLLASQNHFARYAECEFSIIDSTGEKTSVETIRAKPSKLCRLLLKEDLLSRHEDILPNDCLTLQCTLAVSDTVNISNTLMQVPDSSLVEDFGDLLLSGQSADVILICGGEEFKAHKLILSTRSKVFAAMFNHEMKEKNHSYVDIVDMDKEVLREMLKFIYTDKSSNLDKMTNSLLGAADKYDLQRLRVMCEQSLANKISIENAVEILILADAHSARQLKKQAIRFIISHKTEVVKTFEWIMLAKERPYLIVEAFEVEGTTQTP